MPRLVARARVDHVLKFWRLIGAQFLCKPLLFPAGRRTVINDLGGLNDPVVEPLAPLFGVFWVRLGPLGCQSHHLIGVDRTIFLDLLHARIPVRLDLGQRRIARVSVARALVLRGLHHRLHGLDRIHQVDALRRLLGEHRLARLTHLLHRLFNTRRQLRHSDALSAQVGHRLDECVKPLGLLFLLSTHSGGFLLALCFLGLLRLLRIPLCLLLRGFHLSDPGPRRLQVGLELLLLRLQRGLLRLPLLNHLGRLGRSRRRLDPYAFRDLPLALRQRLGKLALGRSELLLPLFLLGAQLCRRLLRILARKSHFAGQRRVKPRLGRLLLHLQVRRRLGAQLGDRCGLLGNLHLRRPLRLLQLFGVLRLTGHHRLLRQLEICGEPLRLAPQERNLGVVRGVVDCRRRRHRRAARPTRRKEALILRGHRLGLLC